MNTLDDLRATLVADAASVEGGPHTARAAGVEGKIRTIRRQRRAGAAAGVAALAAVVGLAVLPNLGDDPRTPPEERLHIAGHVVPQEIELLDFDYRLASGVEAEPGADSLELEVEGSDRNQAVSVAVDDLPEGGTATLRRDGMILARVVGPSRLALPIPLGHEEATLTLTVAGGDAETRIGLAAYERTDELAAGIEDPTGTVVFRSQVADRRLLNGVFLEPGEGEATFTVEGPIEAFALSTYCDSNGQRVFYNVSVDGTWSRGGRCGDAPSYDEDPAGGSWSTTDQRGGGQHEIRVWTTDRQFSEKVVPLDDVIVGAAVYRATPARTVLGNPVERTIEWDGRLWELSRVAGRQHRLEVDGPRVVGFALPASETAWLEVAADGGRPRRGMGSTGGSGVTDLLWPGRGYDLALVTGRGTPADGAILVYRPVP